jgi:hypothetical protein
MLSSTSNPSIAGFCRENSRRTSKTGARHDSGIAGSLWGRLATCSGLATRLFVAWADASVGPVPAPERPSATRPRPQDAILPHK